MALGYYGNFKRLSSEGKELSKMKRFKYRGAIMISDFMLGVLAFVAFVAFAFMNSDTLMGFAKWASTYIEMVSIKDAATTYSGLRIDGANPTSVNDLIEGVSATDSIDGTPHTDLMSAKSDRWRNGLYCDAFGTEYVFGTDSDGARIITSAGRDKQMGTEDDIIKYY